MRKREKQAMIYHETGKSLALASRSKRRTNDGFSTEISSRADAHLKVFGFALMHDGMRSISGLFFCQPLYLVYLFYLFHEIFLLRKLCLEIIFYEISLKFTEFQ
jgi:hypothetical protein